jgi:hypothetical protein
MVWYRNNAGASQGNPGNQFDGVSRVQIPRTLRALPWLHIAQLLEVLARSLAIATHFEISIQRTSCLTQKAAKTHMP